MKDNTQEKNLIEKNEDNNIFIKIKNFFRNIFYKKNDNSIKQTKETVTEETDNNYSFKSYIKRTESEETKLLDLQNRYRKGEIADDDLTQEQINSLCMLYDKQIEDLKRTIEAKKQQISKYKKIDNINKKDSC